MTVRFVKTRFSEARIRKSIARILRENVLCSMSTIAPGNRAHINTAYFCYSPDLTLYFLSDPGSLHCKNLERHPSMAMTIFTSAQDWGGSDRGMQLFGTCRRIRGRATKESERLYGARFPAYGRWMRGTSEDDRRQAAQLRSYGLYRFRPTAVKILDEREFGGGVFVLASVRRHPGSKTRKPSVSTSWRATQILRPS